MNRPALTSGACTKTRIGTRGSRSGGRSGLSEAVKTQADKAEERHVEHDERTFVPLDERDRVPDEIQHNSP